MNLHKYTDKPMSVTDLSNETIYFCDNKKVAWKCAKSTFKNIARLTKESRRDKHNAKLSWPPGNDD